MNRDRLIVYGAGGHGLVVAEAARAMGHWAEVVYYDDDLKANGLAGWERIDEPEFNEVCTQGTAQVIVAIGDNAVRERVAEKTRASGGRFVSVIHPAASVSVSARLGEGVFVGPLAVVHAMAQIGDGAIVNSSAVVEHHNEVGRFAHVGPGAAMGGRVRVGPLAMVGVGASVRPDVTIGAGAIVGAGAVVVSDVKAGATVVGVPARVRDVTGSSA